MIPNDAQDRLSAMLAPLPFDDALFTPTSRYHGVGTAVWDADGDLPMVYLRRRLVPHPERLATIGFQMVADRDRPDTIAAVQLGNPELFWRLCDANRAVFADELVAEIGRRLRVAAPEGTPGAATGGTDV